MKSLLDIQKDIRNIENSILEISTNIKQVNDDIEKLRNQDNNAEFDYEEIKKLSKNIPFKKHPICRLDEENTVRSYLEMLINIIKLDDKNSEDKIDTRLIFIQWIINSSKFDITLEELIVNSLKIKSSDFDEIISQLNKNYKELLVVDLLIVANMNGTFNADECNYVVDMLTILGIDATKLKLLFLIAKMVLCQKSFDFDKSLMTDFDLIKELKNYKHYRIVINVIEEKIKSMRTIVVDISYAEVRHFKWKCKQQDKVVSGTVIATYQNAGRFGIEQKKILAPADGTIYQFRDNNVIYGVISHESDNKDSIMHWIKNERR